MELRTENNGTKNKERWNQHEGEYERLPEGERTWKRRRNIPSYNRMTRVNRYEKSIIYPSSIGSFSLRKAFLLPSTFFATFIADSIANASLLLYLCSDITQ